MLNQELNQIEAEELDSDFDLEQVDNDVLEYTGKRTVDIILTMLLFILFGFWAMAISFFLSWIELPLTSPLFIQKRVGKNGNIFNCLKIRTMRPNKAADIIPVQENDKRITVIGKILRKTNLDELPQFFNVLKGDMSLVGPRPYMVSEDEALEKMFPEFKKRKSILPGITGNSQIAGLHNLVSNKEVFKQRIESDLKYVYQNGLKTDMVILFETLKQFLGFSKQFKNGI